MEHQFARILQREPTKILDKMPQVLDSSLHGREAFGRGSEFAIFERLKAATNHRQRIAQMVGNIGGHLVEGGGQFAGRDASVEEFFIFEPHHEHGLGRSVLSAVCEQVKNLGVGALHREVARK